MFWLGLAAGWVCGVLCLAGWACLTIDHLEPH